jgi:hypothetical protein
MPISPLEMGRKTCQWIKETFGHFKEFGPMRLLNTQMKIKPIETS